jgi:vacuolar-type H+-ATPase subunit H
LDELKVILEAEAEARRQYAAATEQAAQLVRAAETEAQQQVRAAHEAHESTAAAVEAHLVGAAREEATRLSRSAAGAAADLGTQAAMRFERAVEALVNAVLSPETDDVG